MVFGKFFRRGAKSEDYTSIAPSIEEQSNGALIVKGDVKITCSNGKKIISKGKSVQLCRCGASKKQPYCDRSHKRAKFDSSPSDQRTPDGVTRYEGKEINIYYNRLLCSQAAICGKQLKPVFDSDREPWIIPDNGTPDEVMSIVKACPSGALRYSRPNEMPKHILPDECFDITIEKNGPYHICGVPLTPARLAEGASSDKYDLCRCGASKNKPYCDGTHEDIKWESHEG